MPGVDDLLGLAGELFGDHAHFGDTSHARYLADGFAAITGGHPLVDSILQVIPSSLVRFYEKDGSVVPRGILTTVALAALKEAFPGLDTSFLHVTVPRHPLHSDDATPQPLPDHIASVVPADRVDLRPQATPIGDQGQTSRCAAFAWTHALELLGNLRGRPFPRLAPTFTMYGFQQRQGDARDFEWAWKGGDGTAGTSEPGRYLFTTGTCRQDLWPDDVEEPRASLDAMSSDAHEHVLDADVYDVAIADLPKLLSAGYPVQISMATGEAFQDIGRDGVMKVAEAPKGQHGYHAMLCVGYMRDYCIVKNSWGAEWGDRGYCYIPRQVLVESEPDAVAIVPRGATMVAASAPVAASSHVAGAASVAPTPPKPTSFGLGSNACKQCGAPRGFGVVCAKCGFNNG